jgi:hypothetical protein
MRTCDRCAERLGPLVRADARFCSTRCRVAAHRARRIVPAELRIRDRWVRYSARKVPLTVRGRAASSTDPSTWSTFDAAAESRVGVGVGFVLDGDGVVCIDLDQCLEGRRLAPWAQAILAALPRTYVEVSPSGTGLHVWGYGDVDRAVVVRRADGGGVELYATGRYITVTGDRWADAPLRFADLDVAGVV